MGELTRPQDIGVKASSVTPSHDWITIGARAAVVVAAATAVGITIARMWPASNRWAQPVSDLFFDLSLAYIGAWVFHLVIVVWPSRRDRERLQRTLRPMLLRLTEVARDLQEVVEDAALRPPAQRDDANRRQALSPFPANLEQLTSWCQRIFIDEGSGTVRVDRGSRQQTDLSWDDYLASLTRRATRAREEISALYAVLEAELLEAIEKERSAAFHRGTSLFLASSFEGNTLEWCAEDFADYIQRAADLEAFAK